MSTLYHEIFADVIKCVYETKVLPDINIFHHLLASTTCDAKRLIPKGVTEDHPAYLNHQSKLAVLEQRKAKK